MVFNRIRRALSNNDGTSFPAILAVFLFVVVGFVVLFQFFYATEIVSTVEEKSSSVVENALIANAETSYQAKRDGYSGTWQLGNGEVSNSVVYIDPRADLAQKLGLVDDGNFLIKNDGEKLVYRLHDISLSIENPEFQEDETPLKATISLIVDISLNFPLVDSYPVSIPIEVSAAWNRKF